MVDLNSQFFPYTCTISRRTLGPTDEVGESTYTWADLATGVICDFQDKGSIIRAGRQNLELENPIGFLRYDQDIQDQDQITNITKDAVIHFAGPFRVSGVQLRPPRKTNDSGYRQVDLEQVD